MTPSRPDAERELNDLRARAYGPESDIEADPAAIARLIELETAQVAAATLVNVPAPVDNRAADAAPTSTPARDRVAASPAAPNAEPTIPATSRAGSARSLWQHATLMRGREWFVVGSIVVAAILGSAAWLLAPHADATLQQTEGETDSGLIEGLLVPDEHPDISTLHQFERYHDIDVWSVRVSSVENSLGNTCLLAWDRRGGGRFQYECLATGIELAVHMTVVAEADDGFGEWLADGSIISLHLRENTVDVFVHSPPSAT